MKYERFEDLPVWKLALELGQRIYILTRDRFFTQPGDLRDQLRRAALSVSNNIAESFERGSTAELLYFIYIARGSAAEVRSMLRFIESAEHAQALADEIAALITLADKCSRQLRGWAEHLQDSDIKGQRHLTSAGRQEMEAKKRAESLMKRLDALVEEGRLKRAQIQEDARRKAGEAGPEI